MKTSGMKGAIGAAVTALALVACDGLLEVSDPNRITSEDVDKSLAALANGIEGAAYEPVDEWVVFQALLADVYQSTDTAEATKAIDQGDISNSSWISGIANEWSRAKGAGRNAEERFRRVLGEAEAESSALTAQVRLAVGLVGLYEGMTFCWLVSNGDVLTDREVLAEAENDFTKAIVVAQLAGRSDYAMAAQAGRAQARALQLEWAGAASDAAAIPEGFSHDAAFPSAHTNEVFELTTVRRAVGIMYPWWPTIEVDDGPGFMSDPSSGLPDPRIPVYFDGEPGLDMQTPHYGQRKYTGAGDGIPLVHYDLMRLIIAEALAHRQDYSGATAILNELRATVGLPGYATPTDFDGMEEILLRERFAELFLEGQRLVDLHRKGLMRVVFEALNDPQRPGEGRPSKWGNCQTA